MLFLCVHVHRTPLVHIHVLISCYDTFVVVEFVNEIVVSRFGFVVVGIRFAFSYNCDAIRLL